MPCRDDGYGCTRKHVEDLSVKQLEAELRERRLALARAKEAKLSRESEAKRRARLTDIFMDTALKAMGDRQYEVGRRVTVIFSEEDRVESYKWTWGELQIKLQKWLKGCRKFPTNMRFKLGMEDNEPVLWSWHTHKESA